MDIDLIQFSYASTQCELFILNFYLVTGFEVRIMAVDIVSLSLLCMVCSLWLLWVNILEALAEQRSNKHSFVYKRMLERYSAWSGCCRDLS